MQDNSTILVYSTVPTVGFLVMKAGVSILTGLGLIIGSYYVIKWLFKQDTQLVKETLNDISNKINQATKEAIKEEAATPAQAPSEQNKTQPQPATQPAAETASTPIPANGIATG